MTAPAATFAGARRLYVVSGLAAFLAMLANLVEIVLGFGGEIRQFRCCSMHVARIAFQACSFNHSDISPFKINAHRSGFCRL